MQFSYGPRVVGREVQKRGGGGWGPARHVRASHSTLDCGGTTVGDEKAWSVSPTCPGPCRPFHRPFVPKSALSLSQPLMLGVGQPVYLGG